MNYTNSPVFDLTATHCSACGRPLVDGTSIEKSMGPVCRGKYGYEDAYPIDDTTAQAIIGILKGLGDTSVADKVLEAVLADDSRKAVNVLNHAVAIWAKEGTNSEDTAICLEAMKSMGYVKLADRIGSRMADVEIEVEDGLLVLNTPFDPAFVSAIKGVKGRRWNQDKKVWTVPASEKVAVWSALKDAYAGSLGIGPKGMFRI